MVGVEGRWCLEAVELVGGGGGSQLMKWMGGGREVDGRWCLEAAALVEA